MGHGIHSYVKIPEGIISLYILYPIYIPFISHLYPIYIPLISHFYPMIVSWSLKESTHPLLNASFFSTPRTFTSAGFRTPKDLGPRATRRNGIKLARIRSKTTSSLYQFDGRTWYNPVVNLSGCNWMSKSFYGNHLPVWDPIGSSEKKCAKRWLSFWPCPQLLRPVGGTKPAQNPIFFQHG